MITGISNYCSRTPYYIYSSRVRLDNLDCYLTTSKFEAKKYTLDEAKIILNLLNAKRETIVNFAYIDVYSKVNNDILTEYEQQHWKKCNKYIKEQRKQKLEKLEIV
jgi:hypothetical protein